MQRPETREGRFSKYTKDKGDQEALIIIARNGEGHLGLEKRDGSLVGEGLGWGAGRGEG